MMNPDNPDRVSFAEWGRMVGVSSSSVRNMAVAYDHMKSIAGDDPAIDFATSYFEKTRQALLVVVSELSVGVGG